MQYSSTTPGQPLCRYIGYLWELEDAPAHSQERILPTGTIELVVNLSENEVRIYDPKGFYRRYTGVLVSGAYKRSFIIDSAQHEHVIGVHFRPGGAYPFLGLPVGELADDHVSLQTLLGNMASELREKLCEARTTDERFRVLEACLLSVLSEPREHHRAVRFGLKAFSVTHGRRKVRDVAESVGLSQRRFIQVFTDQVGMTPKVYARVQRFHRAIALARESSLPDWGELAQECGYYDQSHLIHDFREFASISPTDFACLRSGQVKENHLPILA